MEAPEKQANVALPSADDEANDEEASLKLYLRQLQEVFDAEDERERKLQEEMGLKAARELQEEEEKIATRAKRARNGQACGHVPKNASDQARATLKCLKIVRLCT